MIPRFHLLDLKNTEMNLTPMLDFVWLVCACIFDPLNVITCRITFKQIEIMAHKSSGTSREPPVGSSLRSSLAILSEEINYAKTRYSPQSPTTWVEPRQADVAGQLWGENDVTREIEPKSCFHGSILDPILSRLPRLLSWCSHNWRWRHAMDSTCSCPKIQSSWSM